MTVEAMSDEKKRRDYKYLVAAFGEEKIKSRYCFLEDSARLVIQTHGLQDFVHMNSYLIRELACDYFADIERLKEFHEIGKVNAIKVASYTAFWICRRKPLYFITETVDEDTLKRHPELKEINEWFAAFVMIADVFDKKTPLFQEWLELRSFNVFCANLRYNLIYRIFTAQSLELALVGLMASCMYPPRTQGE